MSTYVGAAREGHGLLDRYYTVYLIVIVLALWALASYDFNLLVLTFPDIATSLILSATIVGLLAFGRDGRVVRTLGRGLRFTNGIACGPDGRLYVAETLSGEIFAYDLREPAPRRERFGNCLLSGDDRPLFKGPDWITFGADGQLYCTVYNQGVATVLDRDGRLADRVALAGQRPTNIAFRRNGNEAVVTEVLRGAVEIFATPCAGLPLFYPAGLAD